MNETAEQSALGKAARVDCSFGSMKCSFFLADLSDSEYVSSEVLKEAGRPLLGFGIPWYLSGLFLLITSSRTM